VNSGDPRGRGVAVEIAAADTGARMGCPERPHLRVELVEQQNAGRDVHLRALCSLQD
jgi:hypothetical protein